MDSSKVTRLLPLPQGVRNQVEAHLDNLSMLKEIRDARVLVSLGPAGVRGLVFKRGKQGVPTEMPAHHVAHFDWRYPHDHPEMAELYTRAKQAQWNGDSLPWETSVDPLDPERPIIPDGFIDFGRASRHGVRLSLKEQRRFSADVAAWLLSQFLHGEQGALLASAQVTEAVPFFDGKLYGATQVMDEARHVEVFHRYLDTKLEKLYQVNDNLYVIIDALMTDGRWDMKFLGMQIMVEGLALGAFGLIYRFSREPLLRQLLRYVILDEARHVHYGVLALREYFTKQLTESERREREDWAFEVSLLMRDRFLAYEVYEEWAEHLMSRAQWREVVTASPGFEEFRQVMFTRLVPNLREIGLLTPRIRPHYERVGLMKYFGGLAADRLEGEEMIRRLEDGASASEMEVAPPLRM